MKRKFLSAVFSLIFLSTANLWSGPIKIEDLKKKNIKVEGRPSVALVLAGGGAKGFAHLPIIKCIEEMDIPIDMVVGTSIGAIIGGLYCSGYSPSKIIEEFNDVNWSNLFSDYAVSPYESVYGNHSTFYNPIGITFGTNFSLNLGKGISNGQHTYQLFKSKTLRIPSDISFDDLEIPFRAVTVDMLTGDAYCLQDGDLAIAMRASMSLPAVFEPELIGEHYFIDGGVRFNVPINVAKNLGYDIIIVIDISQAVRDNPDKYSSNPTVAILNTVTIAQQTATQELMKDATLVICPDMSNFGMFDFKKTDVIYEEGIKAIPEYRKSLEKIRQMIYPGDYDSEGKRKSELKTVENTGSYDKKSYLIPSSINMHGALLQDERYIINVFNKIRNKELDQHNYERFMHDVYLTGNYRSVEPHIIEKENGEAHIELYLEQKEMKSLKIVAGIDFEQTFSSTTISSFDLNIGLQARGFTGIGSMISFRGTLINDFGAELLFFQPFNPYIFIEASALVLDDKYTDLGNLNLENINLSSEFFIFDSFLRIGLRTPNSNIIKIGGFFESERYNFTSFLYDNFLYSSIMNQYGYSYVIFPILARGFGPEFRIEIDLLDRPVFAMSGIALTADTRLIFPVLIDHIANPYITGNLDFRGAIPIGKKISISFGMNAGTEFTGNMKKDLITIPLFGHNTYDRIYFPTIPSKKYFGINKLAASMSLQFMPFNQLTILGGELYFRLNGTVGNVTYDWEDMLHSFNPDEDENRAIWSASLGIGINIKQYFNILLRGGIGSTHSKKVTPFVTVDIGTMKF